jgi:hypothetical protein
MATPKSWTAHDLKQGKMTIRVEAGTLYLECRYVFVDDLDEVLTGIAGGRVVAEVAWTSVPTNVQTALQTIDTWTYNQALAQEGMEDV